MEYNITLNEVSFTNICKGGFFRYESSDIYLSKKDIKSLIDNKEIKKIQGDVFNIRIVGVSDFNIKEIVKRSPVFSDLVI